MTKPAALAVIQAPASPKQLFLLLGTTHSTHSTHLIHSVDLTDLTLIGQALAASFSEAMVVIISATHWMQLTDIVQSWQTATGIRPAATALLGCGDSGRLCLAAALLSQDLVAARVVVHGAPALALTELALTPLSAELTVHLTHGQNDKQVPYQVCLHHAHILKELAADFTADVLPDTDHGLNQAVITHLLQRLQGYIPKRLWAAALQAATHTTHN